MRSACLRRIRAQSSGGVRRPTGDIGLLKDWWILDHCWLIIRSLARVHLRLCRRGAGVFLTKAALFNAQRTADFVFPGSERNVAFRALCLFRPHKAKEIAFLSYQRLNLKGIERVLAFAISEILPRFTVKRTQINISCAIFSCLLNFFIKYLRYVFMSFFRKNKIEMLSKEKSNKNYLKNNLLLTYWQKIFWDIFFLCRLS